MCMHVQKEEYEEESECRPIILLNCFSAEKAKTERSPNTHCVSSAAPDCPPNWAIFIHYSVLNTSATAMAPRPSRGPEHNGSALNGHALATVAWIQHGFKKKKKQLKHT